MKNTSISKILGGLIIVVVVAAIIYSGNGSDRSKKIRIGALIPLSGTGASLGEWMKKGADFAIQEINASGGIKGRQVELVVEDDKCAGKDAVNAYRKLHDVEKLHYFAGPLCAAARIPVLKAAEQDDSLIITAGLAIVYGQETSAKTFNVLPTVGFITEKIVNYAFSDLKVKNIILLSVDDEFGAEADAAFTDSMKKNGFSAPTIQKFHKGTSDLRTEIAKISVRSEDAVLVAGFSPDYNVFMKQAQELGLKKTLLALSPIQTPDSAAANAATAFRFHYPHPSASASDSAKMFLVEYKKIDPAAPPAPPLYLGSGYDAVKLIAQAISKCGEDIKCANAYFKTLNEYPGANGPITFGEKGNTNSADSVEIRTLEKGVFAPASSGQ